MTGGNKLYWDVDYADPSFSDIIGKVFRTTDSPGRQISSVNNAGQSFQFTLISTSPLTSNASTVNSRQLSGTQVRCENTLSHSSTSEIQVVAGNKFNLVGNFFHGSWRTILFMQVQIPLTV